MAGPSSPQTASEPEPLIPVTRLQQNLMGRLLKLQRVARLHDHRLRTGQDCRESSPLRLLLLQHHCPAASKAAAMSTAATTTTTTTAITIATTVCNRRCCCSCSRSFFCCCCCCCGLLLAACCLSLQWSATLTSKGRRSSKPPFKAIRFLHIASSARQLQNALSESPESRLRDPPRPPPSLCLPPSLQRSVSGSVSVSRSSTNYHSLSLSLLLLLFLHVS